MQPKLTYLAVVALLGGCQHGTADPTPAPGLLGTRWALVQVEDTPVAVSSYSEDYNSYIQFAAGNQARGMAACDAIQGQFALGAGLHELTISQLSRAKSSCPSPYVADRYLAALPQTSHYIISHDTLWLYTPQHTQLLVFRAAP